MTVSNQNPVADSLLNPADSVSFDLDDGGVTPSVFTVHVDGSSNELAWSLAGGFEAGFTGSAIKVGNVYTITFRRPAGWDASPFTVDVAWTISGTPSTESWSFTLANENLYPDLMQPRNPVAQGTLIATDAGVPVRTDVGWIDLVGFTVTDLGNGKIRVADAADGSTSFWDWGYETGGGVPSNGKFTADSDSIAFITSISLDDTSGAGPIITGAGVNIKVGDYIALKSGDASLHATYQVTSATNNLGYWTYGVLFSNGVGPTLTDTATYEFGFLSTEDDPDAIHDNVAAEFSPLTGKSNPVGADLLLIEDSDDSFNKKKLILSNLLATLSTQSGFGIWQYAGDADTTPAAGKFSFDTSGIGIADHIYVHENNASGMDMALVLGSLKVDDIIYLGHSSLTTVGSMHKLTGTPTLTAGVWDIPVDGATSGATSSPNWVLNDFAYFVVLTADAGGAGGAGMDQKEYVSGGGAPAAAKMTANADALSSVTTLNLSDSSGVDNNFSIAYGAIKAGDFFVIRDNAGGGAHGTFEVVSSVDNTTYWTFTVTFKNVAGSFVATNDYDIFVLSAGQGDTEATVDLVGDTSTQQEANQLLDGCSLDTPSLTCTSNGTLWSATLEKSGTGDIRYRFNGQTYTLDCTPAAVVILTAGTATVPVINYVYVVESGGTLTLTANTTGFPTTAARVATVYCQDAAAGATDGALKLHQWNDHVASDLGHVSHINEKLRRGNADWVSGCAPTMVIADPNASFNVATGTVYQVHEQTFPAITGATSGMWVVNYHNGTIPVPFTKITSLDTVDWDSAGVSINNRYFPLVVWGTQNANGTGKIFINLPSGSYAGSAAAQADADNYANYNIPPEFKGTGFLIARYNVQGKTSGLWVEVDSVDLRGLTPAGSPSASSGGSGDVVGPGASVLSNAIASYDGTGGLTIKQANVLVGAGSVGTGTRTLGANSVFSGGFLATAGSSIVASGNGSIALGYGTGTASINATGIGSISLGYCSQSVSGTAANITNSGLGSLVTGATAQTVSGTASLNCSTSGAFVGGYASQGGLVEAVSASNGCCATGYADGTGSIIRVTGALGGFASGSAQAGGTIITSGKGAFASGAADIQSGGTAGTIAASGLGSFAGGSALGAVAGGTAQITASGSGSFAWGSVLAVGVTSAIAATATNAVQFGIGTNAVADSLQVGDTTNGLRLLAKGTTSTTVGSFWTDGTDVFCRTGGVTKNLTNI